MSECISPSPVRATTDTDRRIGGSAAGFGGPTGATGTTDDERRD
jgi:hypothetical protein